MEETSVYVCIFSKCCVCAKSLHSCLTLCDLMDCSPPGSSVHGILQARAPEWAAMPSSRGSSWPRKWTQISCNSCIAGRFFATQPPRKPIFPKYIFPTYIYPKYNSFISKRYGSNDGVGIGAIFTIYHRNLSTKQPFCNLLLPVDFSSFIWLCLEGYLSFKSW